MGKRLKKIEREGTEEGGCVLKRVGGAKRGAIEII